LESISRPSPTRRSTTRSPALSWAGSAAAPRDWRISKAMHAPPMCVRPGTEETPYRGRTTQSVPQRRSVDAAAGRRPSTMSAPNQSRVPPMSAPNQSRVPTLRAVDHCAYTVPDLDEAVRFFVDHFGAELVFFDGPFVDDESDAMQRRLNVDPRARTRLAM